MATPKIRRTVTAGGLEWRADSDSVVLEGHASTFNQPYDMGWYMEQVAPGAFTKTLSESPDVRFLVNHDGLPLARTGASNTLDLSQDDSGLYVRATLDASDPDVQQIMPKMRSGILNEMSFAFSPIKDSWSPDYSARTLNEVSLAGGDVSVVTYPANPNATAAIRSLMVANQDRLRTIYADILLERVGKKLSSNTQSQLSSVLDSLGSIDSATGEAVDVLNALLEVEQDDPEEQDSGTPLADIRSRIILARATTRR
jgi:hypothetical protein